MTHDVYKVLQYLFYVYQLTITSVWKGMIKHSPTDYVVHCTISIANTPCERVRFPSKVSRIGINCT
jgi:hypothetical protein